MKITAFNMVIACTAAVVGLSAHAAADPAPRCPPFPAFPDANCTGPVGDLAPYTGSLQFRTDGQVIENVEIDTPTAIYLPANNVTFRNVRFVYTGPLDGTFTIINIQGQNITFESSEFDGRGKVARAISTSRTGANITVSNCNIHHTGNGIEAAGPMLVEDNYIHDIHAADGTLWHADGIQSPESGTKNDNITIEHNTIVLTGPETGAINVRSTVSDDTAKNVLIQHNLLAGGGYTMYAGPGENFKVIQNYFSTRIWPKVGQWGIWYPRGQEGVTRLDNRIEETGAPADS